MINVSEINTYTKENLTKFFNKQKIDTLIKLKLYLDDVYYNTDEDIFSDEQYDLLVDIIKQKDPKYVPQIGAKIPETQKRVKVPFHMGSMDKIRPHVKEEVASFNRWLTKYSHTEEYVLEEKLDGISCLIVVKDGEYKLYKRPGSDGYGADITYLLKHISSIPKNIDNLVVRGEIIMPVQKFKKYLKSEKNPDGYKNARAIIAGLTSSKVVKTEIIKDVDFIAYEIIYEDGILGLNQRTQLTELKELGFKVVKHEFHDSINIDLLTEQLINFKLSSVYEIDGIIVQPNLPYIRNLSGNPDYAFAFKILSTENIFETTIVNIEWNVSKLGKLKPRIQVKPVNIGGVTISYTTGFNAKYVVENNLGPGSIIEITRSGDVIPFIVRIVKQSKSPQLPTVPFEWDKNGTDIIISEFNDDRCIKILTNFFAKIGVKFLGEETIKKLYANGYNDIFKILDASVDDFKTIQGFGDKSAIKLYETLKKSLSILSLETALAASGIFGDGIGLKRLETLFIEIPNLFELSKKETKTELLHTISKINGFSSILAQKIIDNILFAELLYLKLQKYTDFRGQSLVSQDFLNKTIVFSGFRDEDLKNKIIKGGGKVSESVTKQTSMLVINNKDDAMTGKRKKAKDLNITEYDKNEFIAMFIK